MKEIYIDKEIYKEYVCRNCGLVCYAKEGCFKECNKGKTILDKIIKFITKGRQIKT